MTPELKELWLKDLAEAKHGVSYLCRNDRYCCLGRLAVVIGGRVDEGARRITLDGEPVNKQVHGSFVELLKFSLMEKVGLTEKDQNTLSGLNDASDYGFVPVIEWIKANL